MSAVPNISREMRFEQDIEANRNGGNVQTTINYPDDLTHIFDEVSREKRFSIDANGATREFLGYSRITTGVQLTSLKDRGRAALF